MAIMRTKRDDFQLFRGCTIERETYSHNEEDADEDAQQKDAFGTEMPSFSLPVEKYPQDSPLPVGKERSALLSLGSRSEPRLSHIT